MSLLGIENVRKEFDGLVALNDISMEIEENSITGLIGPNGCGKTTLFNVISGVLNATSGKIFFKGNDISNLPTHKINRLGISRTYQETRLYPNLTVLENLMVPPKAQPGENFVKLLFQRKAMQEKEVELLDKALEVLDLLEIRHMGYELAKNLSGGQSKLVDIGRVLMSDPELLLLDEPTAGVNPVLTMKLFEKIVELRDTFDLTILIIEHDMDVILREEVDWIHVASAGNVIFSGKPDQIKANQQVIEAYLGR